MNNFIIPIENKINVESASDENQLVLQYEELKKRFGEKYKILIVFLVPDEMHPNIVKEYKALESKYQNCDDRFKIINWDVICNIIKYIIEQDSKCEINPIDDYLRHTLKALSTFIDDDFSGYYFENVKIYGNMNPLSEGRKTLDEIHRDGSIKFVGVNYGIIGLLSLSKEELEKKTFQFTSETIDSYRWLSRDLFIVIGDSIINNKFINVDWINYINSRFPYNIIYNIAINTDKTFYIGIKGGETSLENMKNEEIEKSQWGLSLKKENNQWVEKKKYIEIFNKKGISV